MKNLFLAISLIVAMFAAGKDIRTVTYSAHLHCEQCVKKVTENISYVKGVKDLDVSLKDQKIVVKYDAEKTSPEKIQQEIKKLGYNAKVIETPNSSK